MPTLHRIIKMEGSFADVISMAQPGEIVDLIKIPAEIQPGYLLEYRPTKSGVIYFHPAKGFFDSNESATIPIHTSIEKPFDWYPFGTSEIILLGETKIRRLYENQKTELIYSEDWFDCEAHVFTDTLILIRAGKNISMQLHRHERAQTKMGKAMDGVLKRVSVLWRINLKPKFSKHVTPIPHNQPLRFHYGHPAGPVYMLEGKIILFAGGKEKVLHMCRKNRYCHWSVSKEGFIDEDEDELTFNEDQDHVFFNSRPRQVFSSVTGAFIVSERKLYFPFEKEAFARLPDTITENDLQAHPYGVTFIDDGWIKLLVAVRVEENMMDSPTAQPKN